MKDLPALLSIVTPVYNGEAFVRRCYSSIRDQTYTNWEWVVVDDGSTDRTRELLNAIAAEDPRVRVFSHAPNRGRGFARMRTLEHARADWSVIWDIDDFYFPSRLEHIAQARARGFDFFCSYALIVDNNLARKGIRGFFRFLGLQTFVHATLACRTDLARDIGYADQIETVGQIGEDTKIGLVLPSRHRGCYHHRALMINQEDREVFLKKAIHSNAARYSILKQLHREGVFKAPDTEVSAHFRRQLFKLGVLNLMRVYPRWYLRTVRHRSYGEVTPGYELAWQDRAYFRSIQDRFGPRPSEVEHELGALRPATT